MTTTDAHGAILRRLLLVEELLRLRPTPHLDGARRAARTSALDALASYARAERFPRNTFVDARAPVFVDAEGTHCAVAALMRASGEPGLVERIASTANGVWLDACDDDGVLDWAERAGFQLDELALIQPSYGPTPLPVDLEIRSGDRAALRARIAAGMPVADVLHHAIHKRRGELVRWLVQEEGARIDVAGTRREGPSSSLRFSDDPPEPPPDVYTRLPLVAAVCAVRSSTDDVGIAGVALVLELGAARDARAEDGTSALEIAAQHGYDDVVALLRG